MSQSAWKIHNVISKIRLRLQGSEESTLCEGWAFLEKLCHRWTSVASQPFFFFFVSPLSSSQVHVKVSVPKGIKFVGHPGKHHLTRKKCVPPGEATPTSIVLSVTELGPANITGYYLSPSDGDVLFKTSEHLYI